MEVSDGVKKWTRIVLVTATYLVIRSAVAFADDRLTLIGRVSDSAGKPVAHATVMVYHAGVKKGYSTYCPSCYVDCGKRTITDNQGMFTFKGLSADLWFQLLVAGEGYEPAFVNKVDPSSGAPITATLVHRKSVNDSGRVFRGRVVDSHGSAVRDAVVQPIGALFDTKTGASRYGSLPGLDPIAISNKEGEFEIAYSQSAEKIQGLPPTFARVPVRILESIEARRIAPAFAVISAGAERHLLTITEGATVRGRLVQDGKPVSDAEVGLIGRPQGGFGRNLEPIGQPYDELRGTQQDGTFAITNVPAPADWYIYGKMESAATRGATGVVECTTNHDKEIVDVGNLQVKPAHSLRGRVVLSDGKQIPDGMRVTISSEQAKDSQTAMLPPDGRFEFVGLTAGNYSAFASVKGYTLSKTPVSVERKRADGSVDTFTYPPGVAPPFSVDHDVDDFVITLHPE
jgi:Carboxypeptidase regulatory-like domain